MSKDRLVPCVINVPCRYPDGTEIEPEKLNLFLSVFDRQFGGCTPLGVVNGLWQGITEPMMRIEVAVRKSAIPKFEQIAKAIGKSTKQKEIYIVIDYGAQAKLFSIDDEDDDLSLGAMGS
jgi:hypothetical protein